jgi:hypothetical protein
MPLVTQKSIISGSLFRSVGQYVGSPVERCLKLWCSRTVWRVRPQGEIRREPQSVCFAL